MTHKCSKYACFLAMTLFAVAFAATVHAKSLRIWVIPNEAADFLKEDDPESVKSFISDAEAKKIIIENKSKGLKYSAFPDWKIEMGSKISGQKTLIAIIAEFLKANPSVDSVHVEFLKWADAYHRVTSLADPSLADQSPDVIQIGSTWTADFAKKNLIAPIEVNDLGAAFFASTLSSTKISGQKTSYAVPWFVDVRLIYYWKKYFPDGDASFSTFESFKSALAKASAVPGVKPFAINIGATWNLMHNLAPWVHGNGGEFAGNIAKYYYAPWDDEKFLGAIEYLHELSSGDLLDLPIMSSDDMEAAFKEKRYAAITSPSDITCRIPPEDFGMVGLALPPAGKGGRRPFVGGSHLAITKLAKDRGTYDLSLALIRHFVRPQNLSSYAFATGFIPPTSESLDQFIASRPGFQVFKDALKTGKSYPSIPEWGEIFENDITKNHLFNLWNDIASGNSSAIVTATLNDITGYLNRRLRQRALAYYAPHFFLSVAVLLFVLIVAHLMRKNRDKLLEMERINLMAELKHLSAQKTVFEAKALILEKKCVSQEGLLSDAKKKLSDVTKRFEMLNERVDLICADSDQGQTRFAKIRMDSSGAVLLDDEPLKFDNAGQARSLIEHVLRKAREERFVIHCMRGFTLFGWDSEQIKLQPNRLFHVAVSKINNPFKKRNVSSLLASCGKGSCSWRVVWNISDLKRMSFIEAARSHAENARRMWIEGNISQGASEIAASLQTDPKCEEAFVVLEEFGWKSLSLSEAERGTISSCIEKSRHEFDKAKAQSQKGIESAKAFIASMDNKLEESFLAALKDEFALMEDDAQHDRYMADHALSFGMAAQKSQYLNNVCDKIRSVSQELGRLEALGSSQENTWACVIQNAHFVSLINFPQVKSLINNFYCYETRQKEDHRLVQLALLCLLKDKKCVDALESEKDPVRFFTHLKKSVSKYIGDLGLQLSAFL